MDAKKRKSWAGLVATLVLAVPPLYVLSVGPFWRIHSYDNYVQTFDRYETVYAPLHWVCKNSTVTADVLSQYAQLWVPSGGIAPMYQNGKLMFIVHGTPHTEQWRVQNGQWQVKK